MSKMKKSEVVVVLALAIVAALLTAMAMGKSKAEPEAQRPRVCFAASKWGPAPDELRPCVAVASLAEDGSVRIVQWIANGSVRTVCDLPNPSEVLPRGLYKATCLRVR